MLANNNQRTFQTEANNANNNNDDDEDGATILDDGLSTIDDEQNDPYRYPGSGMTSAQAAALRSDAQHYHCFTSSLLLITFMISVIVASVRYFGNPQILSGESISNGSNGGGGGLGDLWGNAAREKINAARFKSTLEYLISRDVSLPSTLSAEANSGLFGKSYTPQYQAALWMARYDPYRISIPSPTESSREDGPFKQRYALAVLYFATGGTDRWTHKMNFLSGLHECMWVNQFEVNGIANIMWFGVFCDGEPDMMDTAEDVFWGGKRTVTGISLPPNNKMFGSLPPEIRHLKYLKALHISREPTLFGTIPFQYSALKHLGLLALMDTSLSGPIPREFGRLKKLELLMLQGNQLTADTTQKDLDFLQDMTSLTSIKLDDNTQIIGTLPNKTLSNLKNLKVLSLPNCGFYGPLPSGMSMLTELAALNLEENSFTGGIDMIMGLTNLQVIYLENNMFDGTFNDTHFGELTDLIRLDVSNNQFKGAVPRQLFNLSSLVVVDMSLNNMTLELPSEEYFSSLNGPPSNLEFLSLHSNTIMGTIPAGIGRLKNLTMLDLSINEFTGDIPSEIGQLEELNILFLGNNKFDEAPMPEWIRNMTHLTELMLQGSSLSETIPEWLGELKDLTFLDLGGNNLADMIPQSLGNLTQLMVLILNENRLEGELGLGELAKLETIIIDDNDLTGNTNAMCEHHVEYFISDCGANSTLGVNPELNCTCCTLCCYDGNPDCNDREWFGNHAARKEYGYGERSYWDFGDNAGISASFDYNGVQDYLKDLGLLRK